jgi:5-methylthioribose kinase
LVLKAVKRHSSRRLYFDLTRAFWHAYADVVSFEPMQRLQEWGIEHFAICCLARIDGTSPVDYLAEERERGAVRILARQIVREPRLSWEDVLGICDCHLGELD